MWEELKRPATLIAVILLIVSIVAGVITSFYFYERGERTGRISLRVDQVQVFDKNRIGQLPLKVLNAAGEVIQENVYAANVAVWNSGNAEIAKGAIREPFKIILDENVTPLDLTVISYSSPFEGFQITSGGAIGWEHFDPGHGFKLRIVYVHDTLEAVRLKGSAVGLSEMQDLQEFKKIVEEKGRESIWILVSMVLLLVFSFGVVWFMRSSKDTMLLRYPYFAKLIFASYLFAIIIGGIAVILWSYIAVRFYFLGPELPSPPF